MNPKRAKRDKKEAAEAKAEADAKVKEIVRRFSEVLNDMDASTGMACEAGVKVINETLIRIPDAERHGLWTQICAAIKPPMN